jgi:hypothetical protein
MPTDALLLSLGICSVFAVCRYPGLDRLQHHDLAEETDRRIAE